MKNLKFNFLFVATMVFSALNSSCQNEANKTADKTATVSATTGIHEDIDTTVQMPSSLVNDFEHLLDNRSIDTLTAIVNDFQDKTAIQIAVVTTSSFYPKTTIAEYSVWLGDKWGIGLKKINNGIMVVISATQHQCRISTGLGMEQLLSDEDCQKIVTEKMLPYFQQENYPEGISQGVKEIMRVLLLQGRPMEMEDIQK